MKNAFLFVSILMLFIAINSTAQTNPQFGHIDSRKLIQSLPETEAANKALEDENKKVQEQLEVLQVEYNNKINDIEINSKLLDGDPKKWSDIVMADKVKEVQDLEQRIVQFRQNAGEQLQKKQQELLSPILQKVENAIKEVAKENKFTYIFDISSLLYYSEQSIDISEMVKSKLNK